MYQLKITDIHLLTLFIALVIVATSCSSYLVRLPNDNKWKNIYSVQTDTSIDIEIKKKANKDKVEKTEIRIVKLIPFQDWERLAETKGLDEIIREKNCTELLEYMRSNVMPLAYIDSGPLDLTPGNSKRLIKISKGYALLGRSVNKSIISVKKIKYGKQ